MHFRTFGLAGLAGMGAVLLGVAPSRGESLSGFAKHVTGFELPNGLRFAVMERHEAPVAAVHMIVRAGVLDEPAGQTGIARLMPRMFAHGGDLGVKNAAGEKAALAKVEQTYELWKRLESQKPPADSVDISRARVEFQIANEIAAAHANGGFSMRVLEEAGTLAFEARADADATHFAAALPAHSVETWFKLMADWLRKPSPRRFYLERDAWVEDIGRSARESAQVIIEDALLGAAFGKSGYANKVVANNDGATLRASQFEAFARTFHTPSNTVIAVAGDLPVAEVRRLAELYFGGIPRGPAVPAAPAAPLTLDEDRPARSVAPQGALLPVVTGWPRPPRTDPDDPVFDIIWGLLAVGRDAALNAGFVAEKVPAQANVMPNFPGDRAWSLFLISAYPAGQVTRDAVQGAIDKTVATLRDKPVDEARLARVKLLMRTQLASETESMSGLAKMMARFLESRGSVTGVGDAAERIDKVTAADVQRVARKYLREKGRVVLRPAAENAGGGL